MKVLMTNWIYAPEFSGAALQSHRLALQLSKMGLRVEVLTGTDNAELVGTSEVDGIPVVRVLRDKSSVTHHVRYAWDVFEFIIKNRKKYDLLHSHGFQAPVNAAAKVTGLPLVQKITNLNVDDPITVSQKKMGNLFMSLYQSSRAVIATSKLLEDTCKIALGEGYSTFRIPNGVDTDLFAPATPLEKSLIRRKLQLPDDKVILLSVGTVSYLKGLDMLLKSLHVLKKIAKNDFFLVSVGPMESKLAFGRTDPRVKRFVHEVKDMVRVFGLEDVVRFEGNRQNVHEYMKAADIYVHPSRQEGQPNALLEAMSSGLPAVANLIPGITDEITQNGKFGFIVDCEDKAEFAAALNVLLHNPQIRGRVGRNARREILQRYDIKIIAETYYRLYEKILILKQAR